MARTAKRRYIRRTSEQWEQLVAEQARSGLSQRRFCDERGIAYASFVAWRRRVQAHTPGDEREPAFIELEVGEASRARWEVELALGDGVVLRVRRG